MIEPGRAVIVHLGSPREQVFGIVLALSAAGLVLRGIALSSVEDWLRGLPRPEAEHGVHVIGLATSFYPMHRVEKVVLDEGSYGAPAIHERLSERTGLGLEDFLDAEGIRLPGRP